MLSEFDYSVVVWYLICLLIIILVFLNGNVLLDIHVCISKPLNTCLIMTYLSLINPFLSTINQMNQDCIRLHCLRLHSCLRLTLSNCRPCPVDLVATHTHLEHHLTVLIWSLLKGTSITRMHWPFGKVDTRTRLGVLLVLIDGHELSSIQFIVCIHSSVCSVSGPGHRRIADSLASNNSIRLDDELLLVECFMAANGVISDDLLGLTVWPLFVVMGLELIQVLVELVVVEACDRIGGIHL